MHNPGLRKSKWKNNRIVCFKAIIQPYLVMPAGYSGTPLAKKLGIKPGFRILLEDQPAYYFNLFDDLPEITLIEDDSSEEIDFIHFFVKEIAVLEARFDVLKGRLQKNGMMWISWPKKASKVPTTVDDAIVRATGLQKGLVDVKVCAVDEVWSGLKFVYRVKDR